MRFIYVKVLVKILFFATITIYNYGNFFRFLESSLADQVCT
jgi:hypothetical protein